MHFHSHYFRDHSQIHVSSPALPLLGSGLTNANYLWEAVLGLVPQTLQNKVQNSTIFTLRSAFPESRSRSRFMQVLQSLSRVPPLTPFSPSRHPTAPSASLSASLQVHALTSHLDCFLSGLSPSFTFLNSRLYTVTRKTVLEPRFDYAISLWKVFQWLLSQTTEPFIIWPVLPSSLASLRCKPLLVP